MDQCLVPGIITNLRCDKANKRAGIMILITKVKSSVSEYLLALQTSILEVFNLPLRIFPGNLHNLLASVT